MKLISWNCQGAFRKKADTILSEKPDILVVQECEHPDILFLHSSFQKPKDILWFGDNKHKGLCILSYGNYTLQLLEVHNPSLKYVVPIFVKEKVLNSSFSLYGQITVKIKMAIMLNKFGKQ